jgi:tetratricopeptide (TPR) repeat protein
MWPKAVTLCVLATLVLAVPAVCFAQKTPTTPPTPTPPVPPPGWIPPGRPGTIGGQGVMIGDGASPDSLLGGREVREPDPKVRFQKLMDQADDNILQGKYYEAVQALGTAQILATEVGQLQRVRKDLNQLETVAAEWLQKYQQMLTEKNYVEALKGLGLTQRTFGTLPSAVTAGKLLKAAEGDSEVKTALQEVKAQELDEIVALVLAGADLRAASGPAAQTQPTQPSPPVRTSGAARVAAIQKASPDRQSRAVSTLEKIAKLYPLSPTGTQAAKDLKTLQDDSAFWTAYQAQVAAQQAQSLYNAAEMYRQMGMTAKAIEYYEQVTAKFPASPLAGKAKEAVAKLK